MADCQIIKFPKIENNDMPANILNLPAYTVTAVAENEHDYHINAEVKAPPVPGRSFGHRVPGRRDVCMQRSGNGEQNGRHRACSSQR